MADQNGTKKKRRRWPRVLIAMLVLLAAGGLGADRMLKRKNHPGLRTFVRQWAVNYPASFAVEPVEVAMRIDEKDLEQLQQVVEDARARGVILPEGNSYVPAVIESAGIAFKAKVRIKGKMTDHVEGKKWSFRVIAKKDGGFQGMRRFSLQHPGTRNYLCDWLYHRLMAAEGVAALRYGFIRLRFNDDDLGIYAYEEHFGPELLEHNGRAPGPIFRFDPALFWEHRLNELNKVRFDEPFAAYQAGVIDAFGSSDLEKDKVARQQFEEAVALMDAFRRGKLAASEVFDADRIARHHAILDLVGGYHSMDWSDVKFYYDPLIKRIEPISYESFSARPIRTLAASGRFVGRNDPSMDLHTQWFNDELLFRSYVGHLERISRKSWLDSAFAALKPALDSASATLYREFPYKELDRGIYYKNQLVIRKLLNPPKAFHAYLRDNGPDTIRVTVVPIEALPMEVHALLLPDGSRAEPIGKRVIPVRRSGKLGEPIELRFAHAGKVERGGLKVACSVLGASVQREVEVFPYALLDGEAIVSKPAIEARALPFLAFDDAAKTITMKPGAWTLSSSVELPAGYTVRATAPMRFTIAQGARLLSRSPLIWKGLDEAPVEVVNDGELVLLETGQRSELVRVAVSGSGSVLMQQASIVMERCAFSTTGGGDHVTLVRCTVEMRDCVLAGGSDGLTMVATKLTADGCEVRGAKDDGIVVRGGSLTWKNGVIQSGKGASLKLGVQGEATVEGTAVKSAARGIETREGAVLRVIGGVIEAVEEGVVVKDSERISGANRVELQKVVIKAGKAEVEPGAGNRVQRDGSALGESADSVEKKHDAGDDAAH